MTAPDPTAPAVCVVGSGTEFLSGISYYTYHLASCLRDTHPTSAVLMRRLVPRALYPGASRVGAPITELSTADIVPTFDGVDWYSPRSVVRAGRFLDRHRPDVVTFQWWIGAVLPAYLYLARRARRRGAKVVLEFHEDQDTGESALPLVGRVVRPGLRRLIRRADAFVVHSAWDQERLCAKFGLPVGQVRVVLHGPYAMAGSLADAPAVATAPDGPVRILFFGTIRPYKGLEDLVDAFDLLGRDGVTEWRLVVVGETWEGWTLPAEKIAASPHRDDIEFVNRYVTDGELRAHLDQADVVVLPYTRSSASGPLHIVMQRGLPVVVTDVGGLTEAAQAYAGVSFVPPSDPGAIAAALSAWLPGRGARHVDPHSWDATRRGYDALIADLLEASDPTADPPTSG